MSLPEVIFFDVGDTLIRAHPSWAGVYREGLLEFGIDIDREGSRASASATRRRRARGGSTRSPFEPTEENSYARIKRFDLAVLARVGHHRHRR